VNIVERGKAFAKRLRELAARSVWDWKQCPYCGSSWTIKNGWYARHPWGFGGRDTVRVQRHLCHACHKTYAETSPWLVRRSWYYRSVHRAAVDHWLHLGTSLRRTAEVLRSWMGHQERWLLWHPLGASRGERSTLSASTVHRWLDGAGQRAAESVPGQLAGIGETQELGTDGLWAQLKGQVVRVVLMTVDSVSGLIYPPGGGAE
jgi:transposase-like protein